MLLMEIKRLSLPKKILESSVSPKFLTTTRSMVTKLLSWVHHSGIKVNKKSILMIFTNFRLIFNKMIFFSRNKGEILALTGCDLLTIAPKLLAELEASTETVEKCLDAEAAKGIKKFR